LIPLFNFTNGLAVRLTSHFVQENLLFKTVLSTIKYLTSLVSVTV